MTSNLTSIRVALVHNECCPRHNECCITITRERSSYTRLWHETLVRTRSAFAAYRTMRLTRLEAVRVGIVHGARLEVHTEHEYNCVCASPHVEYCPSAATAAERAKTQLFAAVAILRDSVAEDQTLFEADCALARALRGVGVAYTRTDGVLGWLYPRTRKALAVDVRLAGGSM